MITKNTTLAELAAIVSDALERSEIVATLSGGAAVSIYSENRFESEDLDFVTVARAKELKKALEPLGFKHTGTPRLSVFEHPKTNWYLEFPPAPLGFGGSYVDPSECAVLKTSVGKIRIITPTHSIMDRLISAAVWKDAQSLEQALLVAEHQRDNIDWNELDRWVTREDIGGERGIVSFYDKISRPLPD